MSKELLHSLRHFWLWKREFLLSSFALSVVCSLVYHFFPYHNVITDCALVLIPFFYIFPGLAREVFSWKYYQSLPLTKRDLYHYIIAIQYLIYSPFLVWYFAFPGVIKEFIFDGKGSLSYGELAGSLGVFFAGCFFLGLTFFKMQFQMTRAPYTQRKSIYRHLQTVRDMLYGSVAAIVAIASCAFIGEVFPAFSKALIKALFSIPGLIFFVGAFLSWFYWHTFRVWNREELSYFRKNFVVKRDVPLMGVVILGFAGLFSLVSSSIPGRYGQSGEDNLITAIHSGNRSAFYRHLKNPKEVQSVTKFGWTPLMVAAHSGNLEFFQELRKAGASESGKLNRPDDKLHHEFDLFMLAVDGKNPEIVKLLLTPQKVNQVTRKLNPIHVAAFNCATPVIELLLDNGADIHSRTGSGQTALHVAARQGCFSGVVSLIERGSDPLVKNEKGLIAVQVVPEKNLEMKEYLERKGRIPAGKKP